MTAHEDVLGWLAEACESLSGDAAFRKLGTADFRLALVADDEARLVEFSAFGIALAGSERGADLQDADLIIELSRGAWRAYLEERAHGAGPSLLELDLDRQAVRAPDPVRALLLERYNLSVQALVDRGARIAAALAA
jgi:hypothetical protein